MKGVHCTTDLKCPSQLSVAHLTSHISLQMELHLSADRVTTAGISDSNHNVSSASRRPEHDTSIAGSVLGSVRGTDEAHAFCSVQSAT